MKLIETNNWSRRDFRGKYECEFCGHIAESYGYDDDNFYENVIPSMVCEKCGKHSENPPDNIETKYPAGLVM